MSPLPCSLLVAGREKPWKRVSRRDEPSVFCHFSFLLLMKENSSAVPTPATVAVLAAAVSYGVILALPFCQDTTYVDMVAELSQAPGFLNIWDLCLLPAETWHQKMLSPQLLIWRKPSAHLWDRGSPVRILHLPAQRATITQVPAPVLLWTREP